jgi:hypothetical protein
MSYVDDGGGHGDAAEVGAQQLDLGEDAGEHRRERRDGERDAEELWCTFRDTWCRKMKDVANWRCPCRTAAPSPRWP